MLIFSLHNRNEPGKSGHLYKVPKVSGQCRLHCMPVTITVVAYKTGNEMTRDRYNTTSLLDTVSANHIHMTTPTSRMRG